MEHLFLQLVNEHELWQTMNFLFVFVLVEKHTNQNENIYFETLNESERMLDTSNLCCIGYPVAGDADEALPTYFGILMSPMCFNEVKNLK
jgi:hypothetical protein